jgi:transcription initiation factor TFIID subunit 10
VYVAFHPFSFGTLADHRKRLLALCTQKFISDLATDAYQFSKIRSTSASSAQVPQMGARAGRQGKDKGRSVLTLEDLSAALGDGGVNVKRPEFYR